MALDSFYKPVKTARLYEQIVEQVEESILKGRLKTGEQLPAERELAQSFGVSRTAVREAIRTLREKGLVEAYSGRGTFVTYGTPQAVRQSLDLLMKVGQHDGAIHLAELRQILEPEIAALAALRIKEQLLCTMREALSTMDRSLHDPEAYVEADLDFHLALAEATQNPLIPALMDTIIDLLREQRKRTALVEGGLQRGQSHHKKILEAVMQRDPQAARLAMRNHLQQVRQDSGTSVLSKD